MEKKESKKTLVECPYFEMNGTKKDNDFYCKVNPCPYGGKTEIKNSLSSGEGEICTNNAKITKYQRNSSFQTPKNNPHKSSLEKRFNENMSAIG